MASAEVGRGRVEPTEGCWACGLQGLVAERFFVPALETLSTLWKIPPDVAGATLLALGTGAPDIFSEIAALPA